MYMCARARAVCRALSQPCCATLRRIFRQRRFEESSHCCGPLRRAAGWRQQCADGVHGPLSVVTQANELTRIDGLERLTQVR